MAVNHRLGVRISQAESGAVVADITLIIRITDRASGESRDLPQVMGMYGGASRPAISFTARTCSRAMAFWPRLITSKSASCSRVSGFGIVGVAEQPDFAGTATSRILAPRCWPRPERFPPSADASAALARENDEMTWAPPACRLGSAADRPRRGGGRRSAVAERAPHTPQFSFRDAVQCGLPALCSPGTPTAGTQGRCRSGVARVGQTEAGMSSAA